MAISSRQCPQGYQMINGVCQSMSMPGIDCCAEAMNALTGCHSHSAGSGCWSSPGCNCTQTYVNTWDWDSDTEPTHSWCNCTADQSLYNEVIACCLPSGGSMQMRNYGGGRSWRRGGKIKRRRRR